MSQNLDALTARQKHDVWTLLRISELERSRYQHMQELTALTYALRFAANFEDFHNRFAKMFHDLATTYPAASVITVEDAVEKVLELSN